MTWSKEDKTDRLQGRLTHTLSDRFPGLKRKPAKENTENDLPKYFEETSKVTVL